MNDLSIVIASQDAEATIGMCLAALRAQDPDGTAQIIVVDNSRDRSARIVAERFPAVHLLKISTPALFPELWGRGAALATGRIVAFTTAHCIPDAAWIAEILRHHEAPYAGIGGAIENLEPASLVQWAVFFCRYSGYMLPFFPHAAAQIPGDNGTYKRWVLERYVDLLKAGFWETVINDRVRKDGHSLLLTPALRVSQGPSFGPWAFCRQRLALGRLFGAGRAHAAPAGRRLLYVASSPLIPFVFLGKISRQVFSKRRHRYSFLRCLPILGIFVLAWSVGEGWGYLQALKGGSRARHATDAESLVRQ